MMAENISCKFCSFLAGVRPTCCGLARGGFCRGGSRTAHAAQEVLTWFPSPSSLVPTPRKREGWGEGRLRRIESALSPDESPLPSPASGRGEKAGRFANRTYGVCGVDAGLIVPTLLRRLLLLRKLPGRRFRRVDKRSAIHRLLFSAAGAGWIFQEDEWVDGATLIHPTSRILCVSAQAPVLPLASCVLRRGLFCGSGF